MFSSGVGIMFHEKPDRICIEISAHTVGIIRDTHIREQM